MTTADPYIPAGDVPSIPWLPRRPSADNKLHVTTVWRWMLTGRTARNGQKIKLRAVRIGGTLCTREDWLREFFAALTAADPQLSSGQDQPAPRTAAKRQRASARANAKLEKIGA